MLIHELTLHGILSFGPTTPPLEMKPLNVLIGPNGSGKSNLIEAVDLLRSSATKLAAPTRGKGGGGIGEWIYKGHPKGHAVLEAIIDNPPASERRSPVTPIRHRLEIAELKSRFEVVDESIENATPDPGYDDPFFYYRYQNGNPVISVHHRPELRRLERQTMTPDESILSQRKDPEQYPELAYLSNAYRGVRIFREWSFGRSSPLRSPQPADMPSQPLEEDFSNIGLFLNSIGETPKAKRRILALLGELYDGLDDFREKIVGGTVEVSFVEGDFTIPASRLSDGTLRYLCLLAILCDPEPPSLICIEEPELGLHPDMIPRIAELLIEVSNQTQLIVTTHSDVLVDALSDIPESVVTVEKHDSETVLKRLVDTEELRIWVDKYRLGGAWTRNLIGGNRW